MSSILFHEGKILLILKVSLCSVAVYEHVLVVSLCTHIVHILYYNSSLVFILTQLRVEESACANVYVCVFVCI